MKEEIHIGVATAKDEPRLRHFLHHQWRPNHPLSLNPWLLRWQHRFPEASDNRLTFMVAHRVGDVSTVGLLGVLGFIPFRRFDPAADWSELALALWKVDPAANIPGLGVRLHDAVMSLCKPELVCVLGTTESVRPLYRALRYQQGTLAHAALFSASGSLPTIARCVPAQAYASLASAPGIELLDYCQALRLGRVSVRQIDDLAATNAPRKSTRYVELRYLDHPYYQYEVRLVQADGIPRALVIWRRVHAPAGSVLRIVDIIGDAEIVRRCGPALRTEVEQAGCEYMDVMYYGIPPEIFCEAGFVNLDDHPELVLPSHFAPFKQANVRMGIAYKYDPQRIGNRKMRFFRADSDQDRPNENSLLEPRTRR